MNWTSFLLTLTLAYLAYYGLNLLYDLLRTRRQPKPDSAGEVLFFEEHTRPEIIEPTSDPVPAPEPSSEPIPDPPSPEAMQGGMSGPILSTGAVGLKALFDLAKDNLIEYTGAITY